MEGQSVSKDFRIQSVLSFRFLVSEGVSSRHSVVSCRCDVTEVEQLIIHVLLCDIISHTHVHSLSYHL